jgi:peptidase E
VLCPGLVEKVEINQELTDICNEVQLGVQVVGMDAGPNIGNKVIDCHKYMETRIFH